MKSQWRKVLPMECETPPLKTPYNICGTKKGQHKKPILGWPSTNNSTRIRVLFQLPNDADWQVVFSGWWGVINQWTFCLAFQNHFTVTKIVIQNMWAVRADETHSARLNGSLWPTPVIHVAKIHAWWASAFWWTAVIHDSMKNGAPFTRQGVYSWQIHYFLR